MFGVMIDPLDPQTLKDARMALQLSRADVASMTGVDVTTIFRIEEKNQKPNSETWLKLVRGLQAREAA